jgi:hypothetical protein
LGEHLAERREWLDWCELSKNIAELFWHGVAPAIANISPP